MCTAASEGLHSREIGPAGEAELAVTVKSAGAKGMGAYAAEAAQPGRWVGRTKAKPAFRRLPIA